MIEQIKLDDHTKKLLLDLFTQCRKEAEQFRRSLVPTWRRNEAFWNNIQRAIETEEGFSTTVADLARVADLPIESVELYERIINIYRAHGESFISALSASLPNAVYTPDDADNPDDISTAKAYQKGTQLIQLKEEAPLKYIKLLYHLYNHGIGFVYSTLEQDKKYGMKKTPVIDYKTVMRANLVCPECGSVREEGELQAEQSGMMQEGMPSMDPSMQSEMPIQEPMMDPMMQSAGMDPMAMQPEMMGCPVCGSPEPPVEAETPEDVPYISSIDETPKGQVKVDIYGPLHVTVQPHVKKLEDSGYLILDTDLDKAKVRKMYPELELKNKINASGDVNRVDRLPANNPFIDETNLCTISRFWFQDWMIYRFDNESDREQLLKVFSKEKGGYIVIINEQEVAEGCEESFIDCWEATESALTETIYAEPYGNTIVPLQEMTNDLIALTMETIESEIPINFFDPSMLNAAEFKKRIARPGDFIPAKPRNGMGLDSSIASTRPATLSKEVSAVTGYLEKQAQFVLGTLPSVFGGQASGGSETLGEYKESRAQALQRLSLPYISAATAWVKSMKKACNTFFNYLIDNEDEAKFTEKQGNGSFINVFIKQTELNGKVGDVSVENSDQLPISWNQKRAMVMDLVMNSANIPMLQGVLMHPENIGLMQNTFGLGDFYIPGDDDRDKQLREIKELLQGQAMPGALGPDGLPGPEIPSVNIDPEVDNHPVHIEVCKAFLVSEVGQNLKKENPGAYQNVLAHLIAHLQLAVMQPPPEETEPQGNNEMENVQ